MKKDSVYLVWNHKSTGNKFKIGELYKEGEKFYFRYILENVAEAMKEGFQLFLRIRFQAARKIRLQRDFGFQRPLQSHLQRRSSHSF